MARPVLYPFIKYFGGKYRASPFYPAPMHRQIIEPFAGSAGYSVCHFDHDVLLLDTYEVIAGIWQYLIRVSPAEIRALPLRLDHVDEVKAPQEAKWLISMWIGVGASSRKTPSAWMRSGARPLSCWGVEVRETIASQLQYIRHWKVKHASYKTAPDVHGTWFIDPPYQVAGKCYVEKFTDFERLGKWCQSRQGQVIVCENEGADWLPFQSLKSFKSGFLDNGKQRQSHEVIWYKSDVKSGLIY